MKKRIILFIVLALVLSISLSLSLSACKIAECEHEWEDSAVLVEATCTTAGSQEQKCTKCGTTQTIEIATVGHDLKPVSGKDATCTESGFSAYERCSRCDYNTKGDDLPKLDHSFGDEWKSDDNGHWHECVRDNCTVKSDEGSHADDNHDHKCDDCDFVLPHVFGEWMEKVDATCIAEGRKAHKDCSICGKHFDADGKEIDIIIPIDSNNHDFSESWSSDSSGHYHVCKREGCEAHDTLNDHADDNHDHKCDECTYIMSDCKSNAVPTVKKDETCTEDGYEAYWTCSVCGKKYSDANCATEIENIVVRPAHGHSFTAETVHADYLKSAATCLEKAVYYKSCVHCGLSSKGTDDEVTFSNGDVDASNHTGTLVWVSIDNEYHQQEYNCCHTKVGEKEEHNFVDGICDDCKHGCNHTNNTHYDANPATCTEDGNIEYYHCNLCNKIFSDSDCTAEISGSVTIDALGHNIVLDTDQGTNGYTWADDHSSCVAHGKCDYTDCTHTIDANATVTPSLKQALSCLNDEIYDYTATFTVEWAEAQAVVDVVTNSALGHTYGETSYVFNDEHTAFIATRSCSKCSEDVEGHTQTATATDYFAYNVVTPPTCTEPGVATYQVNFRVDWISDPQIVYGWHPAEGHKIESVSAKPATCTEDGNIAHWICNNCHTHFSDEKGENEISDYTISAAHTYGYVSYAWSENNTVCTATRTCPNCPDGTLGKTQTSVANGDSIKVYSDLGAPTCITNGGADYEVTFQDDWAAVSGGVLRDVSVPALGHDFDTENWSIDGVNGHYHACKRTDCTAQDSLTAHTFEDGICSVCGDHDVYGTEGLVYSFNSSNRTYSVTGYNGTETEVRISPYYNNGTNGVLIVSSVQGFFQKDITAISLPNTITTIIGGAFGGSKLTSISIPDSVTSIGSCAFESCTDLATIVYPNNLYNISDRIFHNTAWYNNQPDGIIYLNDTLVYGYKGVTGRLEVKDGATAILPNAFSSNSDITEVIIPDSVKFIGKYAFNNARKIESIVIGETNSELEKFDNQATLGADSLKTVTFKGTYDAFKTATDNGKAVNTYGSYYWFTGIGANATLICNDETVVISATAKDATCTERGNISYYYNILNGKYYTAKDYKTEITESIFTNTIDHTFDTWIDEEPATCSDTGIKGHKDCSVCGKHFDNDGNEITNLTIDINPNGHNYVDNVCTYCDAKHPSIVFYLVGQINGEDHGVESDAENTGDYKFDNDGKVTVDFSTASFVLVKNGDNSGWYMVDGDLGEDERSTVLHPTETLGENAKHISIPANTKATFTIVINADGTINISFTFDCLVHNLTEHKAKSATCTEAGNIAYWTCSKCSHLFANAEGSALIADANEDGKITLDDTITAKLAHTFDQEKAEDNYLATEATCTENATYYKSCSCGLSSKDTKAQATFEKADSALGHIDENKDHSCDRGCGESMGTHEDQLNSHNCAYCGNPASEHTGGTATCTEKAQCTICGEEYGNVLGHDVSKTTFARNEWKHWNECSRCGDKFNEAEHNYQETPNANLEVNTSVCTGCNLVNDLGTEGLTYRYVAKSDSNPESYYIVTGYTGTATEVRIPYWGQSGEYMYKRVKYIDVNAFYSNSRITKVVLPSCLVEVGEKAFYNCSALAEVEMTSGNIRSYAFNKCTALTEINVPNTLEEGAFEGCTSLTTVKLFSGVYRIPNRAFIGCSSLSTIKYDYRNTTKEGLPSGIVSIGDYAFSGCSSLSNVDLPSDLDTLGIWAFQRTAIKSLTIPSRITEIPNLAFANCSELATINIHDNITKYGDSAFQDCALITTVPFSSKITHIGNHAFAGTAITSVHIPSTVTKILGGAFSDCTSLTSLTFASGINLDTISGFIVDNTKVTTISIPDSVTQISDYAFWESKLTTINISTNSKLKYIGASAFNKSTQLKSIYIPKGVTEIGWRAFNYCENLETVTFATNSELVTIGEEAFFACYKLKSMVIPSGVTVIPKSSFVACREMTSITLPNNLTSIGEKAFEVCSMLDSISIPSGVKTIGDKAFSYCIELKSVTVPADTTLGNGVFANCPKLQLTLTGKGDLVFQNGMLIDTATKTLQIVTYTGSRFVLPDDGSITTIGSYAFYGCENLVELVMSESIVSFGDHAFAECPNLKSVTFSSKITTIAQSAFYRSGIESIVIPSTIETVDRYAFYYCLNLYSVTFEGVPTFGWGAFDSCYSLAELIELGGDIKYGDSYAKNFGAIVNKDGTTKITKDGDFAFITIDSDRYMIGYSGTDTDIVIPSGTTHIKNYAMRFNEGITSLVIPEGVVSIGVGSFQGLKSMTSVTLPTSLKSMGAYAFNNCLSLESISLPDGLESIGEYAFQYCPFSNITIPSTVTTMGKGMLASNEYLESITLPLKNRLLYLFDISSSYIDRTKFYEAKENQSSSLGYYIPLSLKSITVTGSSGLSSYAFSGFTSIESIDVSNATAIYSYAFMDCTSLTEVVLPTDTLTSIGEYAFKNCTSLSGITLPLNVGTIGQKLFEGCTSLDFVVFPRTVENALPRYPFGMVVNNLYYNGTVADYVSLSFASYNGFNTLANNVYFLQSNGTYAPLSGEVVIPDGVKSIGNYVFYGYQNITNIVIPEGVESIGVSAFEGCSLTSVVIPSTVTSIGAGVFGSNPYLESITVPFIGQSSGTVSSVPNGRIVHFFTTALNSGVDSTQFYTILCSEKDYYIPLSLKSITVTGNYALKNYAFTRLKSVESIDVSNIPSISKGLFSNCSSLKTLKLPSEGVETIEVDAFNNCSSLESLTLPESVKTIKEGAFAGCTFTNIVIPSSVTKIEKNAFENCTGLTEIEFKGTKAQWNAITKGTDWNKNVTATIICTDGTI